MRALISIVATIAFAATTGCSILVSNELDGKDPTPGSDAGRDSSTPVDAGPGTDTGPRPDGGGTDAGPMGCVDQPDGTPCGTGFVCVAEECVETSCMGSEDCDDGDACNGVEMCETFGACVAGEPASDGTTCERVDGSAGVCGGGRCVPVGCGNSMVETGEECDDGMNGNDLDGCRDDCTFTCSEDADCDNGDPCDGSEACDADSHLCSDGPPLECTDGDTCTMDLCTPMVGCEFPLIDADGDGHAPDSLPCGDDCDDTRSDVYTGASDICGDGRDNDCNGTIDDGTPTWYIDCDGDTYAADTSGARMACTMPSSAETGCSGGEWTLRRPVDASTSDCADQSALARPGATSWRTTAIPGEPTSSDFDYDCNGTEERRYPTAGRTGGESCARLGGGICFGLAGWVGSLVPPCGAMGTYTACYEDRSSGACLRNRGYSATQSCR